MIVGERRRIWIDAVIALLGAALIIDAVYVAEQMRSTTIASSAVASETGNAYIVADLKLPLASGLRGDDSADQRRSRLVVLENGRPLGPGHSVHEDIRRSGAGRYSHWGDGLYFSASDNSDPRSNGRTYAVAYPVPLAPWPPWAAVIAGVALLLLSQGSALARELRDAAARFRNPAVPAARHMRAWPWQPVMLFAALAGTCVYMGSDRSGWILMTQPFDEVHSANSLLGYSFIREDQVFHKENLTGFRQVAFFSGFETTPDLYFRRPVYTFIAALFAPLLGIGTSLLIVNLAAWAIAVWLCHRFASRFYRSPAAGRWAALLAAAGIGFVMHATDLSAHLLAFTVYMGGVVLIYESEVWRRKVEARMHLVIGAYLTLASLQYNTGLALLAGYLLLAIRHNSLRLLVLPAVCAIGAQPLWGWIVGAIYEAQSGMSLSDLSTTERDYLGRALRAWGRILTQPPGEAALAVAGILGSFVSFESPLVVLLGAGNLLADVGRSKAGRDRLRFALPFVAFPLAGALVFATAAPARGYLVYGVSIFFFASAGALLASLVARGRALSFSLAAAVVCMSVVWSTAHLVNVLGPTKAYMLGMQSATHLFGLAPWDAVALTGREPSPRVFGGAASLIEAGLSTDLVQTPIPRQLGVRFSVSATALLAAVCAILVALATRLGWRIGVMGAALAIAMPALGGAGIRDLATVVVPDQVHWIERSASLAYEVELSSSVKKRLLAGLQQGYVVVLFPAYYTGDSAVVRIGTQGVAIDRKINERNWLLNSADLIRGLSAADSPKLSVTFAGGDDVTFGGWQRVGLPGRTLQSAASGRMQALPAVELRLLRDAQSWIPVMFAY